MPTRIEQIPYQAIYGQIVSSFRDETVNKTKYSAPRNNPELVSERYKVRIFGKTRPETPAAELPMAQIRSISNPVGSASLGFEPILSPNSFVELEQDSGGNWWIVRTLATVPTGLPLVAPEGSPSSGNLPGAIVPTRQIKPGSSGLAGERPTTPEPNAEDEKQDRDNKEENLLTACKKINTDAINSEITNLIKDLESLKTELTGEDSFLQTSQNFFNDAQTEVSELVAKASKKIARWVSWLVQEIRRFVMRKVNGAIFTLSGNAPLSTRFLVNEATKKTLSLISCLFIRILKNLEDLLFNALSDIVNKLVNTAQCLLESFIAQFIGDIFGQITALINGILGNVSSLLGNVISFTTEIIDFAISILDFLECKPENICPQTEKWNPLEGGQREKVNLDFRGIFSSARGIVEDFEGLAGVPDDIDNFIENYNFGFNSNGVIQDLINGCNQFTGPEACGPPNVVFWGGTGNGATGNAVVNGLGDLIGVDLLSMGNFSEAPFISIEDNCGNGRGAIGIPVLGEYVTGDDGSDTGTGDDSVGVRPIHVPAGQDPDYSVPGTVIPPFGKAPPGVGTTIGVVDVYFPDSGYGYLPTPDGSRGGSGRTFAGRCDTIVQRANGDYDSVYTEGNVIRLYYGDSVELPASGRVTIDCDFTIDMLPGAEEIGEKYCFKDMTFFDTSQIKVGGPVIKSMIGFDDTRGADPATTPPLSIEWANYIKALEVAEETQPYYEARRREVEAGLVPPYGSGRPDQFGYMNDYPYARELGFNDTDIRFYLEGFYTKLTNKKLGPLMKFKLDDPNFGPIPSFFTVTGRANMFDCESDYPRALADGYNDIDIRYFLENVWRGEVDDCMQRKLNDSSWGRAPEYYVTLTAPGCPPTDAPQDDSYNVAPVIGDVVIEDPGFGYSDGDTVTVLNCAGEDDESTIVEIDVDNAGRIIKARVVQTGSSYACIPVIRINTNTGNNGVLKAIMRFEQEVAGGDFDIGDGEVLSVIDCVGKI